MQNSLIAEYATGGQKLQKSVAGLTSEQMLAAPIPGKWSTHQVVIHLADAETAFADRVRRMLAEDDPILLAWDENKFAAALHYEKQSAQDGVTYIDITRKQTARILAAMPESALDRTGRHNELGRQTIREVIGKANWHLDHHLKFVHEKRQA